MGSFYRMVFGTAAVASFALAIGCGSDSTNNNTAGSGGSAGTGGTTATGGNAGSAGSGATGGNAGTAGAGLPDTVPDLSAATFTDPTTIDNPYLPMPVGLTHAFVEQTPDGAEIIIVETLDETREVMGVTARVVQDRVFLDGQLIEDTHDWFAQDDDGNVWYMGEEVDEYEYDEDGNVLSVGHEGAWEAGKDVANIGQTALPGYAMLANPAVGLKYHQEYYPGQAEDMGEVLSLDAPVELADGTTYSTLKTLDSPLAGGSEHKYFASGLGVVLETPDVGTGRMELVGLFDVTMASLPDFAGATFTNPTTIDNPFMSWTAGSTWTYSSETEDGTEEILLDVLPDTRDVAGVTCVVVRDQVFLDGVIVEDTHDWYAQDDDGNVWYFGEEVDNYNYADDGTLIDITHDGSWEAGEDVAGAGANAQPGIVMNATPQLRTSYRQEYYEGEAEDMAFIVRDDARVELSDGTVYENCIQTLDWVPLEPYALEFKFYASGVGMVMETTMDGLEVTELVSTN